MNYLSAFAVLSAVLLGLGVTGSVAQDNPIAQARAEGLYGLQPDLTMSLGNPKANDGRQAAWDSFGIYFEEHKNRAFVAALRPGGPAAQQGAKIGDVVYGSDLRGADATRNGILQAFAAVAARAEGQNRSLVLYVYDADNGWQREYRLTPGTNDQTVKIPPALRNMTSHRGLMAILSGNLSQAEPLDVAHDAMLSLQAISMHVKGCSGPDAVTIPISITVTETTTDGFGTFKGSDTSEYGEVLKVRPEFAGWARANIRLYPTQPLSEVRRAILALISQQGCEGAGFKQLETGLAKVMNVALPEAEGAQDTAPGGFPADASAFIVECYPLLAQAMAAKGFNMGERGLAQICLCQEHAARALDDTELYSSLQIADDRYYQANPDLHERFDEVFMQCYRAPDGSDLRNRLEALWREMNI